MFPKYPYLDLSDRNLDFLTKAIREMENEVKNFVTLNAVKYANPIQWSINRQYEKNTIVIDPMTGTAFISVQPVPNGVSLTRTEYWTPVFDLSQFVTKAAQNFANSYERDITTTATMPTGAGDWLVWDSTLYIALTSIHAGDAYVVNGNIKRMTVEDFYDLLMQTIHNLDEELDTEIRNRTDADSTLQHNIDAEAQAREFADDALQDNIDAEAQARENADSALQDNIDAEAQARENADIALGGRIDYETELRLGDVNSLNGKIGQLHNLHTPQKDNLVNAINSVNDKRYIFIGDSYNTTDTPVGGYPITPWGPLVAQFLGLGVNEYYNVGESGCGFVAGSTFLGLLDSLTVSNPETITDIVVCGGVNDENYMNSLGDAINNFAVYCLSHYPNALVTIAMISWGKSETGRPLLENINYYYETRSYNVNLCVIPNACNFYHNYSLWQSENQGHPSLAGSRMIASQIANYLKGFECGINFAVTNNVYRDTNALPVNSGIATVLKERLGKETCYTQIGVDNHNNIIFSLNTPTTIVSGQKYRVGTYTPYYCSYYDKSVWADGFVHTTSGYYPTKFIVSLDQNDLFIQMFNIGSGGYENVSNVDQIAIYRIPEIVTSIYEC